MKINLALVLVLFVTLGAFSPVYVILAEYVLAPEPCVGQVVSIVEHARLRRSPEIATDTLFKPERFLDAGQSRPVVGGTDGCVWYRLSTGEWVHNSVVQFTPSTTFPAGPTPTRITPSSEPELYSCLKGVCTKVEMKQQCFTTVDLSP